MEKAYDTTWKYGILKDLYRLNFRGRLPIFIERFLSNRIFRVKVDNTVSDPHKQELGVPQGSILSVTLFSIKIDSIAPVIGSDVLCSLYVDDICICYRSKHINTIERKIQLKINKMLSWSIRNGFKFSQTKTVCMHFCQLRSLHNEPELFLDGTPIEVAKETKFLGIIFDNKLSFIPHIKMLKKKCSKGLNILKVLSKTKWGADMTSLMNLYRTLIRSKLDYGSIVYGSARKSYIQALDTIHHQGIRLALGAYRTSPIQSLYVEANEPSLENRRLKLALQYAIKLKTNKGNPAYPAVFTVQYSIMYERKPNHIRPFGLRIKPHLENLKVDLNILEQTHFCKIPPWDIKKPFILLDLSKNQKSETHPNDYQLQFLEIRDMYPQYTLIYTDGSKSGNQVAAAFATNEVHQGIRIPDQSSIFTAEANALLLALKFIETSSQKKFLIMTDSKSCLDSLESMKTDHPTVVKIFVKLSMLKSKAFSIYFCWVPGHSGIAGNEKADSAAKEALSTELVNSFIPFTDLKQTINEYIRNKWQSEWDQCLNNKLHEINPDVKKKLNLCFENRWNQVIYTRCRIGHSKITHKFLLLGENPPKCSFCQNSLSIKHILLDCITSAPVRNLFYSVDTFGKIFNQVNPNMVLRFLEEINVKHLF